MLVNETGKLMYKICSSKEKKRKKVGENAAKVSINKSPNMMELKHTCASMSHVCVRD